MRAIDLRNFLDGVDPDAEVFVAVQLDPSAEMDAGDVDFQDDLEGEFCSTDVNQIHWEGGAVCIVGDWSPE